MKFFSFTILFFFFVSYTGFSQSHPFQDTLLTDDERIENVLSLMTIEEKIENMASRPPGISRLGIKGPRSMEGVHGLAYSGVANWSVKGEKESPTTIFPQAIGLAQTWDTDLLTRVASHQAEECRYLAQHPDFGIAGLIIRAPVVDPGRDARWGRLEECYGEDAFLSAELGVAFIKGLQGNHPRYWKTASLMKHFLANSNENNRYINSSDFGERLFYEYYGYPFYKGITEGGSQALMAAYNKYNGIPCTVHPMLNDIVKGQWGLKGIICTDGGGFKRLVDEHHYFENYTKAAQACIEAGINMFLDDYKQSLRNALDQNLISESDMDEVLKGIIYVWLKLGLLDNADSNPYKNIGKNNETPPWETNKAKQLAKEAGRKSIVLLKNENQLLPLDKNKVKSVAVIGPLANVVLQDWYSGSPPYAVSILEGIKNSLGENAKINFTQTNKADSAIIAAQQSDVAIVCIGNHPVSHGLPWGENYVFSDGREEVDRQSLNTEQEDLVRLVRKYNPNTILVVVSSFPYTINWSKENVPAILHTTHACQELGNAVAGTLFGEYNPAGRLVLTWPKSITDLPPILDYDITKGRTYMYAKKEPLFPFGYGLSYTSFEYSDMELNTNKISKNETLKISCNIENTGNFDGEEVVQVYVKYPESELVRPNIALKGFQRVFIKKGETKKVEISVDATDFMHWDKEKDKFTLEKGQVEIFVGASSKDLRLNKKITLK